MSQDCKSGNARGLCIIHGKEASLHGLLPGVWCHFQTRFPTIPKNLSFPGAIQPYDRCLHLVGLGSSLAGLELLKVPVADRHVATLLVHALGEVLRGAGAVVRLALVLVVVVRVIVLLLHGRSGGGLSRCRGAAAEHAADGVADGGAYCDTAGGC